ncbi:MAG TPA: DnaJ domain-containing protein [Candidatus Fimimonas merdipullorum]|uniref:DnaJ domain-containing protein n=1 Tax=Candidatus Fimimonas merdipullorum TaxID=2840822 RepID=A0A9D1MXF4_9BACT|nr:DnaJ domain-containing protein [Candidatus Fimimonas merdipullorum]
MDYNYNPYEILGIAENATPQEIEEKYLQLREKYQKDRFLPGEAGEEASEKLQQIEVAYRDILLAKEESKQTQDFKEEEDYSEIQQMIMNNRLDDAQTKLDNRVTRDAEWHYIQSILFYKRNWFLESKKQLELACQMEPDNQRYKQSLEKLTKILASNTISPDQLRTTSRPVDNGPRVGAGNGTCTGSWCMDCILCNACCDCMQCMGGGC